MSLDLLGPVNSAAAPVPSLLERTLGPDWRCLPDAVIRAGGEAGPVDLVALHPRLGVVLVALLAAGEEASPEEAVAALRSMLRELGCAERFPGQLNVAATILEPDRRARLAESIRAAAGDGPEAPAAEGWVDWLAEHLTAAPPKPERPRLVAPISAEAEPPAVTLPLTAPRERILLAAEAAAAKPHWLVHVTLAIIILAPVLAAVYARGGVDFLRQIIAG